MPTIESTNFFKLNAHATATVSLKHLIHPKVAQLKIAFGNKALNSKYRTFYLLYIIL